MGCFGNSLSAFPAKSVLPELESTLLGKRDTLMMLSAYQLPHYIPQPDASGTAFSLQLPVPINLLILEKTEMKNWEFVACVIRARK